MKSELSAQWLQEHDWAASSPLNPAACRRDESYKPNREKSHATCICGMAALTPHLEYYASANLCWRSLSKITVNSNNSYRNNYEIHIIFLKK